MPRISPPGAHLPGLDGLRAYAVLVVVLFHCDVPGFTGGWIGVDVFFGLSGFLITGILAHELDRSGTISLRDFWRRRMRRLVPALVVLMLFCVVLALTVDLELRTSGVWGAVTYTTNWVHILVPGNGYWDAFAAPDPLEHLWSLAIEEQFYVLWPIVVLLVGRRLGRSGLARVAVALAGVSLVLQIAGVAWGWSIDRLYQGTDTRAFPFLLGSALALVGVPRCHGASGSRHPSARSRCSSPPPSGSTVPTGRSSSGRCRSCPSPVSSSWRRPPTRPVPCWSMPRHEPSDAGPTASTSCTGRSCSSCRTTSPSSSGHSP